MADTPNTFTLIEIVWAVEADLAAARATLPEHAGDFAAYHIARRTAEARLTETLTRRFGARFSSGFDGARFRLAGITAASTSGLFGAITNWLPRARAAARSEEAAGAL